MDTATVNQEAMNLLEQAAYTSSLIKDKERQSGEVKTDHMYPVTREETDKMAGLLAQAWEAAEDKEDPEFRERYDILSEIVKWSNTKHRTWNWGLIIGTALFAVLPLLGFLSTKDDIKSAKEQLKQINAWTPCDTTITWESCAEFKSDAECHEAGQKMMESANNWKSYQLSEWKRRNLQNVESSVKYRQKAETSSTKEDKETNLGEAEYWQEKAQEYKEKFDRVAPMNYDEIKEEAGSRYKEKLAVGRRGTFFLLFIFVCFLALIGMYIWTGYPYGYELTRTRTRDKILTWIRKAGFWLAGLCFGSGLAAQLFADDNIVKSIYSDGHTETRREADVAGTAMNVMWKIALMVIGVIVFVGVSVPLLAIEAIGGLPEKIREIKAQRA